MSLVKYAEYPKIFSLMLGEALWNDAVAVVLSSTIQEMLSAGDGASWDDMLILVWDFFLLSLFSSLIGVVFGLLSGLMTKYMRFLTRSAIHETTLLFLLGFGSYFAADAV